MKRFTSLLMILVMIVTVASCNKDNNNSDLITISPLSQFVLISGKGLVLDKDTITLLKSSLKEFVSQVDTSSSGFHLTYSYQGIALFSSDSPPPGYTDPYVHKPNQYFTDYYGIVSSDSMKLIFCYSKNGTFDTYPPNIDDSLVLISIEIKSPRKAIINNKISIGDDYNKLFQFYERPRYCYQDDVLRKEYSYDSERLRFTLDNDTTSSNYGAIIGIAIK